MFAPVLTLIYSVTSTSNRTSHPSRMATDANSATSKQPPKISRLPNLSSTTSTAIKRKNKEKSRVHPEPKRHRPSGSSVAVASAFSAFEHRIPGIINFTHSTWSSSQGDSEGSRHNHTSTSVQTYIGDTIPVQEATNSSKTRRGRCRDCARHCPRRRQ